MAFRWWADATSCADPGIFVRGGGGGGVQVNLTKISSDNVFFFFFFLLVLSLFYSSQMVNFKENNHFSRFQRGSNIFQGGPTFSRGGVSNCLFPIETHITCDLPGGGGVRTLCSPSGSALVHSSVIFLVGQDTLSLSLDPRMSTIFCRNSLENEKFNNASKVEMNHLHHLKWTES